MEYGRVNNPEVFFHELGGLHDARIEDINWLPNKRRLSITIDDMNSNFIDLPEYGGLPPPILVFVGVRRVLIDIDQTDENLNIYEFEAKPSPSYLDVSVKCWPGGRLEVTCESIDLHQRTTA